MRELFNYENKFMQALMTFGDLIILNVLFLLCCIPVVTVGAAQAGLYTGLRVVTNPEDDSSVSAAFFRGLKAGFGRITVSYTLILLPILALLMITFQTLYDPAALEAIGVSSGVRIIAVIALCSCAVFQTVLCLFHSRFTCSIPRLYKNTWMVILCHPLRSIGAGFLTWIPVILLLTYLPGFVALTPLFLAFFYSFMCLLAQTLLRKPFQTVIDTFNERNGLTPEPPVSQEDPDEQEEDA